MQKYKKSNLLYITSILSILVYLFSYSFNNYITIAYMPLLSIHNGYLYILGTNKHGLDLTYIIISSLSKAIVIGGVIGFFSLCVSLLFGVIKGFYGKYVDILLQRIYEVLISIPIIYVVLMISGITTLNTYTLAIIVIIINGFVLLPYIRTLAFQESNSLFINTLKQANINNFIIMFKYMAYIIIKKLKFVIILSFFSNILFLLTIDFLKIKSINQINYTNYSDIFLQSIQPATPLNVVIAGFLPIILLSIMCINIIKKYSLPHKQNNLNFINISKLNLSQNNIILGESGSGKTTLLNYLHSINNNFIVYQNINELYSPNITILKHFNKKHINKNIFKMFNINTQLLTNKYITNVSLGQLQWITLAFVLSNNKSNKTILLDEPFAFLDTYHQNELLLILQQCNIQYNKTYVITIHNSIIAKKLQKALCNTNVFNLTKKHNIVSLNTMYLQDVSLNNINVKQSSNNTILLTLNNATLANNMVLNASIIKNTINLIIGENGSGKSTLLKSIYKALKHKEYNNYSVGYVPQEYSQILNNNFKIITIIKEITKKYQQNNQSIINILWQLNLKYKDIKNKSSSQLSMGQLHRICIALILLQNHKVIILDEPSSGLDNENNLIITNLINKISLNDNVTFIIASHNQTTNNNLNVGKIINLTNNI